MKTQLIFLALSLTLATTIGCKKSDEPNTNDSNNSSISNGTTQNNGNTSNPVLNPKSGTAVEDFTTGPIVYRSYNGKDYFFSTTAVEGPKSGYYPDEARFGLFNIGTAGTITLYRCVTTSQATSHFLSTDPKCEGLITEGALGNISTTTQSGLVPLKRYVNLSTNAHIVIVPTDRFNLSGWRYEGTLGYATELKIPDLVRTPDDGERYFSYYAGAMDGVGNGNYISELQNYSNLVFIKSPGNLEQKLAECEQRGLKAIVTFDWLFLDDNFRLRGSYAQNFKSVESIIQRYETTIAAFYGQDEPYWNSEAKGLNPAEVYYTQETIGRFLKSKFPDIPIAVIFTTNAIKKNRALFPSYDWYGFDCYDKDLECDDESVESYFRKLNTAMTNLTLKDGKPRFMMAVPQVGHPDDESSSSASKYIVKQTSRYRQIVMNYQNLKVVMPFLWQSFNDGKNSWVGMRELPSVKSAYQQFYYDFISRRL